MYVGLVPVSGADSLGHEPLRLLRLVARADIDERLT